MDLEHEKRLAKVEERSKSNTHRLDELEEWRRDQTQLTTSVALMAEKQNRIEEDVSDIKTDVRALAEKPGKRWEGLVDKAIWAVASALIGFLLALLGVGG